MSRDIMEEFMLFFHAAGAGAGLFMLYDVLRIFRVVVPHGGFLLAAEDLLYWMFNGVFLFWLMYRENNGEMRGYAVAGVILGMLVWGKTGSRAFGYLRKKCEIFKKRLKKEGKQITISIYHYFFRNEVSEKDGRKSNKKAQ